MSQPRVITSRIAIAMVALTGNSVVAYASGREPAIFAGPVFLVLLGACAVCVTVWVLAERHHRREVRAQMEDLQIAVAISEWQLGGQSGSFRRPPTD